MRCGWTVIFAVAACDRPSRAPVPELPIVASASAPPSASTAPAPALLRGEPLTALTVAGFADAIVSLPLGTETKRPVIIAVHGNYDRPEWQCRTWRSILERAKVQAFVLCPRGIPRTDSPSADDTRFTFASGAAMTKELDAGLDALRARWADFVDDGPMIYTGFSLGAIHGVAYVLRDPSRFPRLVLTEGSHDKWTPGVVKQFASRGGTRVLFACGQQGCVGTANGIAAAMKGASVQARVVHGKGVGHGYDGAVADEIAATFGWLVEGDARFLP